MPYTAGENHTVPYRHECSPYYAPAGYFSSPRLTWPWRRTDLKCPKTLNNIRFNVLSTTMQRRLQEQERIEIISMIFNSTVDHPGNGHRSASNDDVTFHDFSSS